MALVLALFSQMQICYAEEFRASDCKKVKPRKVESLAYTAANTKQTGWLTVPVFYVTDRDASCKCFSQTQESAKSKTSMHYGLRNVVAPRTVDLDKPEEQKFGEACDWTRTAGSVRPTFEDLKKISFPLSDAKYSDFQNFSSSLAAYQSKCVAGHARDEIVVLVHGCCQPFNNHIDHAAFLTTWMKVPIISYDWTSPNVGAAEGKLITYRKNEILNQRNQDRFSSFMNGLIAEFGGSRIVIVGHSMGNRLIENYLIQERTRIVTRDPSSTASPSNRVLADGTGVDAASEVQQRLAADKTGQHRPDLSQVEQILRTDHIKERIKEIVFACADTDAIAFSQHIDKIIRCATITRIIQSKHDELLAASKFLHGKYSRLGSVDPAVENLLRPHAITRKTRLEVVDVSALEQNHSLPLWVVSSRHLNQDGVNPDMTTVNDNGIIRYVRVPKNEQAISPQSGGLKSKD